MQTHKRDLTITAILCMDESLMEIILLTLFVDELYLMSTKVILLYFGDVKRNSPIYSRWGEMIPLVDEPHVHIIPMDGINKFIYKNGHIQTLV